MANTQPTNCLKCNQADRTIDCNFCGHTLYCSKSCEAEDFMTHRHTCDFKGKNLRLQSSCAVCPSKLSATSPACNTCRGIKYCSAMCMANDAHEHGVICQSYASLQPRPSQGHRLHLMLPCHPHPALEVGLVWRQDLEEAQFFVAPGLLSERLTQLFLFCDHRHSVSAYYALNSDPNELLGDLISGTPTQKITGSFSIFVTEFSGDRQWLGDALPSDLHQALYRVALVE